MLRKFYKKNWSRMSRIVPRPVSSALIVAVAVLTGSLSGCSSSVLPGQNNKDDLRTSGPQSVAITDINGDCFGIDLSSSAFTVPAFRGILRCLNGNGSIAAYERLVSELSDAELQSILEVLNNGIIRNQERFVRLDQSFTQSVQSGLFARVSNQQAKILDQASMVQSALDLMGQLVTVGGAVDSKLLEAVRLLSLEAFPEAASVTTARPSVSSRRGRRNNNPRPESRVADAGADTNVALSRAPVYASIDVALKTAISTYQMPSTQRLVRSLKQVSPSGVWTQELVSQGVAHYILSKLRQSGSQLSEQLLQGVRSGEFFEFLDRYYLGASFAASNRSRTGAAGARLTTPVSEAVRSAQVLALEQLFSFVMSEEPEAGFQRLASLFASLNQPLMCLDATKEIPNAALYLFDSMAPVADADLPQFLSTTNLMRLRLASSACDLPSSVSRDLAVLGTLNSATDPRGRHLVTVGQLTKAARGVDQRTRSTRLQNLMLSTLGDRSAVNLRTHMAALLGVGFEANRTVLSSSLDILDSNNNRARVRGWAEILLERRTSLQGDSIHGVLLNALSRVDASVLARFLREVVVFGRLAETTVPNADVVLETLREAVFFNDTHPVVDFLVDLLRQAPRQQTFFSTLAVLPRKNSFNDALRLTARLAREGRLQELIRGYFQVLRGATQQLALSAPVLTPLRAVPVASNVVQTNYQQRAGNVTPRWTRSSAAVAACQSMDVGFDFFAVPSNNDGQRRWNTELQNIAACSAGDADFSGLEPLLRRWGQSSDSNSTVMVRDSSRGRTLNMLQYGLARAQDFFSGSSSPGVSRRRLLDEASDIILARDTGDALRDSTPLLDFLFRREYATDNARRSFGQSLFELSQAVVESPVRHRAGAERRAEWAPHFEAGARIVENGAFPRLAQLLRQAKNESDRNAQSLRPRESMRPRMSEDTMRRLALALRDHEGITDPVILNRRLGEVERDYWQQLQNGVPRTQYANAQEFKTALRPMIDNLVTNFPGVLESTLGFFKTLDHHPYTPEWLAQWFVRLAQDVRVMPYYYPGTYPGTHRPTVRLVSLLDLLELVVIDADFSLMEIGQNAPITELISGENPRDIFSIRYLTQLAESDDRPGHDVRAWVEGINSNLTKYYVMCFPPADALLGTGRLLARVLTQPELKRRMFNLRNIYPLFPSLLANQHTLYDRVAGRNVQITDLHVLRDLFRAVLGGTPVADRHEYNRQKNSLAFIGSMVRFGLTRMIGVNLTEGSRDRPQAVDVGSILSFLTTAALTERRAQGGGAPDVNPDTIRTLSALLREDYGDRLQAGALGGAIALPGSYTPPTVTHDFAQWRSRVNQLSFGDRFATLNLLIDRVFDWTRSDRVADVWLEGQAEPPLRRMTVLKASGAAVLRFLDSWIVQSYRQGQTTAGQNLVKMLQPYIGDTDGLRLLRRHLVDRFREAALDPVVARELTALASVVQRPNRNFTAVFTGFNPIIADYASTGGVRSQHLRSLVAELFEDPNHALSNFLDVAQALGRDREFERFRQTTLNRHTERFLNWLAEEDSSGNRSGDVLPGYTRRFIAEELRRGRVFDVLDHWAAIGRAMNARPSNSSGGSVASSGVSTAAGRQAYEAWSALGSAETQRAFRELVQLLRTGVRDRR